MLVNSFKFGGEICSLMQGSGALKVTNYGASRVNLKKFNLIFKLEA